MDVPLEDFSALSEKSFLKFMALFCQSILEQSCTISKLAYNTSVIYKNLNFLNILSDIVFKKF